MTAAGEVLAMISTPSCYSRDRALAINEIIDLDRDRKEISNRIITFSSSDDTAPQNEPLVVPVR